MSNRKSGIQIAFMLISGIILIGAVLSYFLIPSAGDFANEAYSVLMSEDEREISQWVGQLGIWGPIIFIIAMVLQLFLLIVPSPLLMVVAVLAYGPVWGALLSIGAITVSATVGYALGRWLGSAVIRKFIGKKKEHRIKDYVERYGLWAVIATRLAPFLSNDAISLVAGAVTMTYWKFILATLAGITPLAVLIAWFGEDNSRLKSGLIWISAISLVLLAAYIVYDQRRKTIKN
jgi:uncharacterized membrane protein YdjX (TVP38/TMEM64 family)